MRFAITGIRATRVNLHMNDYVSGLPNPLASVGFADTIVRRLDLKPWSAKVLPILHGVHVSVGRTRPEYAPSSKRGGLFGAAEMPEDLIGSAEVSMIVDLPECDSEHSVLAAVKGMRFAGGVMTEEPEVSVVLRDGAALRNVPRGYAVVPATQHRNITSFGNPDSLTAVANILYPEKRERGDGWLIPTAIGYRLLEDPDRVPKRRGTRRPDVPHVFAEPGVGIAELVSVRSSRLVGLPDEEFENHFWRWDARGDLVLGHPAYHPA